MQSQLDIPFKVKAGHIGEIATSSHLLFVQTIVSHFVIFFFLTGRLQLKIPWKNLYTQSVEATLDGVYLLIVPLASKSTEIRKVRRRKSSYALVFYKYAKHCKCFTSRHKVWCRKRGETTSRGSSEKATADRDQTDCWWPRSGFGFDFKGECVCKPSSLVNFCVSLTAQNEIKLLRAASVLLAKLEDTTCRKKRKKLCFFRIVGQSICLAKDIQNMANWFCGINLLNQVFKACGYGFLVVTSCDVGKPKTFSHLLFSDS